VRLNNKPTQNCRYSVTPENFNANFSLSFSRVQSINELFFVWNFFIYTKLS